jgi:Domain of unknown function (DUF4432)
MLHPNLQIASLDQISRVVSSRLDGGVADGMRVIDVSLLDGLLFQVLPDRGLDVGATWLASSSARLVPISWTSKLGEQVAPLSFPTESQWITRFSGGLITTCGLDNVGLASEGYGLHGSFSHRSATNVRVDRTLLEDGIVRVQISGVVEDADAVSRHIRVSRTITSQTGRAAIRIDDLVENLGPNQEPIPMLYHCNFGFPFWSDEATVVFGDDAVSTPRDGDAAANLDTMNFPGSGTGWPERVYEWSVPGAKAVITSPTTNVRVQISWSGETLPRCIQWIHPGDGVSALGIEPSNASVMGRAHDRAAGRLPTLAAGVAVRSWVEISVMDHDGDGSLIATSPRQGD